MAGVSGVAGSATAEELRRRGHDVVGLARDPSRVALDLPVVRGDVLTGDGLDEAMTGADVAYYLVHAIEDGSGSPYERDRRGAENFAEAVRRNGVRRAIYLSVYVPAQADASPHVQSRLEVERIIAGATPQSIALRSPLLIGSGSTFLMFDRIVERSFGVIPLGRSGNSRQAVIDRRDVARFLADAAEADPSVHGSFDLPAAEILPLHALMRRIVSARGVRRAVVRVPVPERRLATMAAPLAGMGQTFTRSLMTVPAAGEQVPDPARFPPFAAGDDELIPLDRALADVYAT